MHSECYVQLIASAITRAEDPRHSQSYFRRVPFIIGFDSGCGVCLALLRNRFVFGWRIWLRCLLGHGWGSHFVWNLDKRLCNVVEVKSQKLWLRILFSTEDILSRVIYSWKHCERATEVLLAVETCGWELVITTQNLVTYQPCSSYCIREEVLGRDNTWLSIQSQMLSIREG